MPSFFAFVECSGREATRCIDAADNVTQAPLGLPCYMQKESNLFLCEECFDFWQFCRDIESQTTWELAAYLRNLGPAATVDRADAQHDI